MITALDTCILLDILLDDPMHAEASASAVERVAREGVLVVGEVVLAELGPVLTAHQAKHFLQDSGIEFIPSSIESALLAGTMFAEYKKQGGGREKMVPGFLLAAHAMTFADRLLTRDKGFKRGLFARLKTVFP